MYNILLDKLVEAGREGRKSGSKWSNDVWRSLDNESGKEVRDAHIENRIRQMRIEFRDFVDLNGKSGMSYDPNKQAVISPDEKWEGILSIPKDNKRFKVFRERGLRQIIHYHRQLQCYRGDMPITSEPLDLDNDGESMSSASTKKLKRKHGIKTSYVNEVKEMLEGVNTRLESLRETMDPLTFGRQLREKIMEVQGFSMKYLNVAFRHLMKDRVEAEFIILSDEESRVDILNDLRAVIGNM